MSGWVFITPKRLQICKKYLEVLFLKILGIQTQIYPQTIIEPKYSAFYLKDKVFARISIASSTELKSSSPLNWKKMQNL